MAKNPRKILYSPGFGAGWSSWAYPSEIAKFMLEYQPIIDYLESGGTFDNVQYQEEAEIFRLYPVLEQFAKECQEKFGSVPYLGGARDLCVKTVNGRVRIHEYDGSESVEEEGEYDGWV